MDVNCSPLKAMTRAVCSDLPESVQLFVLDNVGAICCCSADEYSCIQSSHPASFFQYARLQDHQAEREQSMIQGGNRAAPAEYGLA